MDYLRRTFRSLRWTLTWRYTIVTVGALLAAEALALGALQFFVLGGDFIPRAAAQLVVTTAAPRARPFLEGAKPDLAGLDQWLQELSVSGLTVTDEQGRTIQIDPTTFSQGGTERLIVLDTQDRLLGIMPHDPEQAPGSAFDGARVPGLERVLPAARAGERELSRLYTLTPEGAFTVAAPIRATDGRVLGVLILTGNLIPRESYFAGFVPLLLAGGVVFTAAAALAGMLFGLLTARGLTRRLSAVARTAGAWGQGDFAARVDDRSGDELGRLTRQLNQVAAELEALMATRQQLASLEERHRLARDLHDSVKQQVFALRMNLGTAQALWERDPAQARQSLETAATLAGQAQRELGALIQALRPLQLEGQALAQGLHDYVQAWEKQTGIAATYQVQGTGALPVAVEQALFRVVQEALANIARHSGATAADLALALAPDAVTLDVRDNGRGFDPAQPSAGLGLRSMRERVQALGGTFTIESGGQGTRLTLRVPVNP